MGEPEERTSDEDEHSSWAVFPRELRKRVTGELLAREFRPRLRGFELLFLIEVLHEKVESLQPGINELRSRYYKAAKTPTTPLRKKLIAELKEELMAARREKWMFCGWRDRFQRLLSGHSGKCFDGLYASKVARSRATDLEPNKSERTP